MNDREELHELVRKRMGLVAGPQYRLPNRIADDILASDWLAAHDAALLERVEAAEGDNEQLRVSVNRDFGEPLDEVYKTDGITIVMQQIHDLRRERDALAAKVADAWDEGWLASKRHERSEGQPKMSYWPNPYRAALTEGTEGA